MKIYWISRSIFYKSSFNGKQKDRGSPAEKAILRKFNQGPRTDVLKIGEGDL